MIPLYGFVEGDCLGLLILTNADETIEEIAEKLRRAADLRAASHVDDEVIFNGRALSPRMSIRNTGLQPLDRFDLVRRK